MSSSIGILKPQGTLDAHNGKQLQRQVHSALQQNVKAILIDCEQLDFVDSSGLGVLVRILKTVETAGVRLAFCSIREQFKTLLSLTDMDDVFEVFASQVHFKLSFSVQSKM
ncbi:MAG: STAS domain-containing protein [Prochlorothrix sp.]|nr:STAS domain-containing protein [Prochlorothrix sp.]